MSVYIYRDMPYDFMSKSLYILFAALVFCCKTLTHPKHTHILTHAHTLTHTRTYTPIIFPLLVISSALLRLKV